VLLNLLVPIVLTGQQFLSREAAKTIVSRAVQPVKDEDDFEDVTDENSGPVKFRHDKRLLLPSYSYTSKEQGIAYFEALRTPTLLVRGGTSIDLFLDFCLI
jgi:hypothetical protein